MRLHRAMGLSRLLCGSGIMICEDVGKGKQDGSQISSVA